MTALLMLLLLAAAVLYLSTSGVLIGPPNPPSGPEAWVDDDHAPDRPGSGP